MGIDAEMYVRVPREVSGDECRKLGRRLCDLFGRDKFLFRDEAEKGEQHVIWPSDRIDQDSNDGDTMPDPGETILRLSIWSRYYGEDYERGDLPFLRGLADALEMLIPDGAVWYGGDSSGVLVEPWPKEKREALWAHFCVGGHDPYHAGFDRQKSEAPACTLCLSPMGKFGWGPSYSLHACPCGQQVLTRDGVTTRTTARQRKEAWWAARRTVKELIADEALMEKFSAGCEEFTF